MALLLQLKKISPELRLFILATVLIGLGQNIYDTTFNNYINGKFTLTGFERSFLEIPRELPGFLVIFISAALWFLCSRRLAAVAMFLGATGVILVSYAAPTFTWISIWLFVYSLGTHIWLPLYSSIGMDLAEPGKDGTRLGQMNSLRNLASILASFIVMVGFRYLKFSFQVTFTFTAILLFAGAILLLKMPRQKQQAPRAFFTVHREYNLYYLLSILFGARKQIFITFAPWVLVTIFHQPTQVMASLFLAGGIIGIFFQPFLGRMIDSLGEKKVLEAEAVVLVLICVGYGFARFVLAEQPALYVTYACFLIDQALMSVNMARATYVKKIALRPEDIQPVLTFSVTIDHIFSIGIALIGGVIWNKLGYQYVFMIGVLIAIINFVAAGRIRIPAVIPTPRAKPGDIPVGND
jgi:predicted MFS family arabinose efflux permease